jgi:hypothetical protein
MAARNTHKAKRAKIQAAKDDRWKEAKDGVEMRSEKY